MVIKNQNDKVGLVEKGKQPSKKKTITSVVGKRYKKQKDDSEDRVVGQKDQLNNMPQPDTFPRDLVIH